MPNSAGPDATLRDARRDILAVSVHQRVARRTRCSLWKRSNANKFAHRSLVEPHGQADCLVRLAELLATHHLLVLSESGLAALHCKTLPDVRPKHSCGLVSGDRLTFDLQRLVQRPSSFAKARRATHKHPLHRLLQVDQQMPAIGNLLSARTSDTNGFRIGASAVSGNDLDAGVLPKPVGDDRSLPGAEYFNGTPCLEIDGHGPVAMAMLDRPIVDSDDNWERHWRRATRPAQFAQHGVAAGVHSELASEPGRCRAAQSVTKRQKRVV